MINEIYVVIHIKSQTFINIFNINSRINIVCKDKYFFIYKFNLPRLN